MKRVLLLAATTGYQIRAFGDAAERLGVELIFATDRCGVLDDPWRDRAIALHFHEVRESVAAIVRQTSRAPVDGVLAVGDRPVLIAAQAAERLGLPWHSPDGAWAATNKLATRERLRTAGLLTPRFVEGAIDAGSDRLADAVAFPAVLKPLALSGSRGVIRVDDRRALERALDRLRILLAAPDIRAERNAAHRRVLLESFIEGREYAVEGLMTRGAFRALAIFEKPDPLDGPFFEETIYLTPPRLDSAVQEAIIETIAHAATAIGLHHGPVHAECRVNDLGVWVLEVAARPIGGLCARALRFIPPGDRSVVDGRTLESLLLAHAIGESCGGWRREAQASGVMMIPIPRRGSLRGVSGEAAARSVPGVDDVRITAKPDQRLIPLPEGASYLGFIFARGETPSNVEEALRAAHAALHFDIAPEIRVLQSKDG